MTTEIAELLESAAPLGAATLRLWRLAADATLSDSRGVDPRLQAEVIIRLLDEIDRLKAHHRLQIGTLTRAAAAGITDNPEQRRCDHKYPIFAPFNPNDPCIKCGWTPPAR